MISHSIINTPTTNYLRGRNLRKTESMGNKDSQPQFDDFIYQLKNHRHSPKKLSIRPEQKYRHQMIETIKIAKLPTILKRSLEQCLKQRIQRADLISTVSVISALMRNNYTPPAFQSTIHENRPESRHVTINFNPERFKKAPKKRKPSADQYLQTVLQQMIPDKIKQQEQMHSKRLKFTEKLMRKEISKHYHPFNKLTKVFTEFLVKIFLAEEVDEDQHTKLQPEIIQYLNERRNSIRSTKKISDEEQKYEQLLRKFIHQWCLAINQSCLKPYRKWVLYFTQLPEQKYQKWINKILIDEIWSVNQGYLYQIVSLIIQNNQPIIKIPRKYVDQALVTPAIFQIDQPLQIEGHYLYGIYDMSQLSNINNPTGIFEHLVKIKSSICTDVDKYHDLERKLSELDQSVTKIKPTYQINSDNILGIISYILYRVSQKIQEINRQCIFLRIIYGDAVYYTFGQSSYMLSTITGGIEYLQSPDFKQLLTNTMLQDDKKSTNVTVDDKSKQFQIEINISTNERSEQSENFHPRINKGSSLLQ